MTDLPTTPTPGTDSRLVRRAQQAGILGSALAEQALVLLREGGDGCAFLVAQGALTASQVELLRGSGANEALDSLGEFVLREVIGKGGMGVVYRAVQSSLQREVALKVLAGSLADDPLFRERFIREAKVAASISNSHVVTCYAAGSDQHRLYLAMELMPGGDVERLVLQQAGTLPEAKALAIARDAALGLEAIHQAGLVHRDIKPANLLLDRDGRAKIGDLGLTRPPSPSGVTGHGAVPGTPSFMAPEQICNDPTLDARADIYALGATLYFLLTGRPPFTGSSQYAVVHQAVNESIPDPRLTRPGISVAAAAIVVRAGARDRTKRYASAAELHEDLDLVAAGWSPRHAPALGQTPSARPPTPAAAIPALRPGRPRVLIVDGDPLARDLYVNRCTAAGLLVDSAASGAEALTKVAALHPEAVLLDLGLPDGDGAAVITRLRAMPGGAHLQIVALANTLVDEQVRAAQAAGADLVIDQSIQAPTQVITALKALIGRPGHTPIAILAPPPPAPTALRHEFIESARNALRRQHEALAAFRTASGDAAVQDAALLQLALSLHQLPGAARAAGFPPLARIAAAAEALARQLLDWPEHRTPATMHSLAQAVSGLADLLQRPASVIEPPPLTALVVDDDNLSRLTMCQALKKVGIATQAESDPHAALARAQTTAYALVLSDVVMEGLDGLALVAALRALPTYRATPIILVTSLATLPAGDHLADDVMVKPFLLMELGLKALTHALVGRALPR